MGYKESELEAELLGELRVCCGATDDALMLIHQVLTTLQRRSEALDKKDDTAYNQTYAELDELLFYKERVGLFYCFYHFLDTLDLIEHGCGIRGAWLTRKGREMLTKLDAWMAERSLKDERPADPRA